MTYDLDAAQREAGDGIPFDFTFGGDKYQLPPHVDLLAAAALDAGKLHDGLRRLLGAEQWERINASTAVLTEVGLRALLEEYQKHLGVDLGESAGSTDS